MADIDLKTSTPDTSLPTTGFLFGADSQAASAPSVYSTQTVATTLLGSTSLSGATITADAPVLNMSQTWNNAGVTFTGLKFNITDTASAAASNLLDLGTGGGTYVSRFSVNKAGSIVAGTSTTGLSIIVPDSEFVARASGNAAHFGAYGAYLKSDIAVSWSSSSSAAKTGVDTYLTRRGAANLRLGAADTTGTTAPTPQFLSAQSWASSTNNNQTGANFTIDGSQGTGTGAGGSIVFRVAPAGAISNGTQNGLAITAQLGPFQGKLYLGSATPTSANYALWGDGTNTWVNAPTAGGYVHFGSNDNWGMAVQPASVRLSSTFTFGWTASNPGAALDLILTRDAANTLALRNGANAQESRIYGTFTDTSNYRRVASGMSTAGVGFIRPEGAGTGASGNVIHISGLPTSNPGPGILWNNAGTPAIGT